MDLDIPEGHHVAIQLDDAYAASFIGSTERTRMAMDRTKWGIKRSVEIVDEILTSNAKFLRRDQFSRILASSFAGEKI